MALAPTTQSPHPPGRLGERVDPKLMRDYLIAMDRWLEARRGELDAIDEVAQNAAEADQLTPDLRLSMALWQSIRNRYVKLLQTWDSGRVGPKELEELAALIWGRLDEGSAQATAQALSLPEACKLSDALTAQLRMRLQLDPSGSEALGRLRNLRASVERLRDQIELEPAESRAQAEAHFGALADRVEDLAERASRGGDIGGMLGPLEIETAKFERDLIVNGALRRQAPPAPQPPMPSAAEQALAPPGEQPRNFAERARKELADRAAALANHRDSADAPAPDLTIPDVGVLGPVPTDDAQLASYIKGLQRIDEAMDFVEAQFESAQPAAPASNGPSSVGQSGPQLAEAEQQRAAETTAGLTHSAAEVLAAIETAARLAQSHSRTPPEIVADLQRTAAAYQAWLQSVEVDALESGAGA